VESLYLEPLADETENIPRDEDIRHRSMTTFFKAIYLARGILGAVGSQRVVHVRRAKRLVASMVDILNLDETALLGLTNIKNFDDYTFNHSVNVCVLSLAVGRRIGLSNAQLADLGLAALFHDIGKINIPSELLNKVGTLEDVEFEILRRHPIEGVKQLIRLKGLSSVTAKLMISVFRHHNNVDGTGYPALGPKEELSLPSRIVRIADSYDAMTSRRIYRRGTLNNVEAIEELWNLAGTHYDIALLKAFISTVGIYPPGSLVQLDSGEIAIVIRNAEDDEHLFRPVVKTLAVWDDAPHNPEIIDLSEVREKSIYGYFQGSKAEEIVNSLLL
jgi:HD-GYP domain-containing protein (c-di-GMP phosphodiesterase class II)